MPELKSLIIAAQLPAVSKLGERTLVGTPLVKVSESFSPMLRLSTKVYDQEARR
jgi:hypothetical protein